MEVMEGILLKPGQSIKPFVPSDVASSLVQKLYNLEITSIKELNSYDDKNFHIMVSFFSYFFRFVKYCFKAYTAEYPNFYRLKIRLVYRIRMTLARMVTY